mmetsp:Transcript_14291/g.47752  ORF Transcript_14291/g.47752 Transcript_14291/m.47752 type:complete len:202 (-) Transcript_14291:736-1341(-)
MAHLITSRRRSAPRPDEAQPSRASRPFASLASARAPAPSNKATTAPSSAAAATANGAAPARSGAAKSRRRSESSAACSATRTATASYAPHADATCNGVCFDASTENASPASASSRPGAILGGGRTPTALRSYRKSVAKDSTRSAAAAAWSGGTFARKARRKVANAPASSSPKRVLTMVGPRGAGAQAARARAVRAKACAPA